MGVFYGGVCRANIALSIYIRQFLTGEEKGSQPCLPSAGCGCHLEGAVVLICRFLIDSR